MRSQRDGSTGQSHSNLKFTGVGDMALKRAEDTFLNMSGPGTYNLPSLTGRANQETKHKNFP